jgi:dTDP-4-amino-4,6-dideoxygalactose transaminase
MIPVTNPLAQAEHYGPEIRVAIDRVLASGHYILGPEVEALEREFATYIGTSFAVGVANGTDAIAIALRALDVGPGDEVITVSMTAVATVAAIEMVGASPVLVDVDPVYYTMDPNALTAAISPRTKAVIPVHLYGQPADLDSILSICNAAGIPIVEDASQAHGASLNGRRVGSIGVIGAFSCYPTKNLGALGDAGLLTTNDPNLAARLRGLRQYGWLERNWSLEPGVNSRLDELQAAILRVKLSHLDEMNERRATIACAYGQVLQGSRLITPAVRPQSAHAWHLYVVRSDRRDGIRDLLHSQGVGTAIHYPHPVHLQPAYAGRIATADSLATTECVAAEVLSLPLFPELDDSQLSRLVTARYELVIDGPEGP